MKPTSVEFCPIDAKDHYICGYNPVAFALDDDEVKLGKRNAVLAVRLEREYLTRLHKLQQELAAKYMALVVDEESPEEHDWFHALNENEHNAAEAAATIEFPGETAGFYT